MRYYQFVSGGWLRRIPGIAEHGGKRPVSFILEYLRACFNRLVLMGRAPLRAGIIVITLVYFGAVGIFLFQERGVSYSPSIVSGQVPAVAADLVPANAAPVAQARSAQKTLKSRLMIPALGVNAFVQTIDKTPEGAIGIPTNYTDVGWFSGSAKLGAGNTVVVGHRDTRVFAPGVFRRLYLLTGGEDIYMYDEKGTKFHFRVTGQKIYNEDTDRLPEIVGPTDTPRLTLITCEGIWDESVKRYNQRLVIFADLVSRE